MKYITRKILPALVISTLLFSAAACQAVTPLSRDITTPQPAVQSAATAASPVETEPAGIQKQQATADSTVSTVFVRSSDTQEQYIVIVPKDESSAFQRGVNR